MEPANLKCFEEPDWRLDAQGFRTGEWYKSGRTSQSGGIFNPQPEKLKPGHRYYRFADSNTSRERQVGGKWWVEFETFRTIENYSKTHNLTLPYTARLFLALPYEWTNVDCVVSAFLAIPLKAYSGKGKVAVVPENKWDSEQPESDTKNIAKEPDEQWTPIQHIQAKQLYIPGLYVDGAEQQLFERAFPQPKIEPIQKTVL